MPVRKTLIGIGVLVAILPHLGFPSWLDTAVYTIAGLVIVFLLAIWKEEKANNTVGRKYDEVLLEQKNEPKTLRVGRGKAGANFLHTEKSAAWNKQSVNPLENESQPHAENTF